MKRCLLALALVFVSQVAWSKQQSIATPEDFKVIYSENNGSVPPMYRRERQITLVAQGESRIVQRQGYADMQGGGATTQTLQVTPDQLNALYQVIVQQRVFKRTWQANTPPPVGGSCRYLSITANDKKIEIPCHIPKALQALRRQLIEAVLNVAQAQPEH